MTRIAVGLEYNGAPFCGWQSQASQRGVQDIMQEALLATAGDVVVHASGRTDAGVHACLQIAHFEPGMQRNLATWVRAANACLPPGVKVLWAQKVSPEFHARHSAVHRSYHYVLLCRAAPSALMHNLITHCRDDLSVERMQAGALLLEGEHDFSSFRAASCQATSALRHLYALKVRRFGEVIDFYFCANGFLHHMVRNIMGALLEVGASRRPPEWIGELLTKKDRRLCAPPAAPYGLYLSGAEYPPQFNITESYRPPPVIAAAKR